MSKRKQKWTSRDFVRLWGICTLISIVLGLVLLLFYISGRGEGIVFKQGSHRSVQDTPAGFPMYLYVAIFFGGTAAVSLALMIITKLRARLHKTPTSTVKIKRRHK